MAGAQLSGPQAGRCEDGAENDRPGGEVGAAWLSGATRCLNPRAVAMRVQVARSAARASCVRRQRRRCFGIQPHYLAPFALGSNRRRPFFCTQRACQPWRCTQHRPQSSPMAPCWLPQIRRFKPPQTDSAPGRGGGKRAGSTSSGTPTRTAFLIPARLDIPDHTKIVRPAPSKKLNKTVSLETQPGRYSMLLGLIAVPVDDVLRLGEQGPRFLGRVYPEGVAF